MAPRNMRIDFLCKNIRDYNPLNTGTRTLKPIRIYSMCMQPLRIHRPMRAFYLHSDYYLSDTIAPILPLLRHRPQHVIPLRLVYLSGMYTSILKLFIYWPDDVVLSIV